MQERFINRSYRFGFNGKEKDDEIYGDGNTYEFGGRNLYDARIGRFRSPDPWLTEYPWQTVYAYF